MQLSSFQQASIFAGLLTVTLTLNAFALDLEKMQTGDQPYAGAFKALDRNADQSLSASEWQADTAITAAQVRDADSNRDERLSLTEFATLKTRAGQAALKTTLSDSWITAQVKAKLLEEAALSAFDISVETHQGEVLLSGFIRDPALKRKAAQLVATVAGVTSVNNAIVVKS